MPLDIRVSGGIATVEMAHGPVNALDLELCEALTEAFGALGVDAAVRGVVLTGKGGVFCAGVDLVRALDEGDEYIERFLPALSSCFLSVYRIPRPTVAAVNGHALAGGCILARACDLTVAPETGCLIGLTELSVGVPFPTAGLEIVRARTSHRFAEAVLCAHRYEPSEAATIGFVDELTYADPMARALDLVGGLAAVPASTYELVKDQVQRPCLEAVEHHGEVTDRRVLEGWLGEQARAAFGSFLAQLGGE